jgi:hypothetical protein
VRRRDRLGGLLHDTSAQRKRDRRLRTLQGRGIFQFSTATGHQVGQGPVGYTTPDRSNADQFITTVMGENVESAIGLLMRNR